MPWPVADALPEEVAVLLRKTSAGLLSKGRGMRSWILTMFRSCGHAKRLGVWVNPSSHLVKLQGVVVVEVRIGRHPVSGMLPLET